MVMGMRSPPSRTLSITNCPGLADAAMSGASRRKNLVTGVSCRVSMIFAMSVSGLQQRVLVHRLDPAPAAVGLGLDAIHERRVGGLGEVARLAHELEPLDDRHAPPGGFGVVVERRVAVLDLVEREEAAVDRGLQHGLG